MSALGFAPHHSPGVTELGGESSSLIVTFLAHLFPGKLKTWNWGNPSFSVLQVFLSKLVTKPSSNGDND